MQEQIIQNESIEEVPKGPGVLTKSIESGKWMVIGYVAQKMIGLLSFLVLARLLTPTDFGIMAIVIVAPKFLQSVIETGFGAATIQKSGDIKHYLNPIWTFGILKALLITIIVVIAGPSIARFFHAESAQLAIQLGGLLILISHLHNVGETYFFKDLDFKKIFIRNTVGEAIYVIASLLMILWSHSYWALVAGTFASYTVQAILTYILHPYRPSISFRFGILRDLFGYGKWIVIRGWISQTYGLLESIAVGRIAGVTNMGLYSKAKSLASVVPGFLGSIIGPVSFPAYAKIRDAPEKIREGFSKSLHLIFFFLIPVITLMIVGGGKIILIFLGTQWLPMTNPLRIFLLYYLISIVVDIVNALLNGTEHPDVVTKLELIKITVTTVSLFYLTGRHNIVGAASALLIGVIPVFFISIHYLKKLTSITLHDMLATINIPLITSLVLLLPTILFKEKILHLTTVTLILLTIIIGLLYILLIYIVGKKTKSGPYNTLKLIFKHIKQLN